MVLSKLVKNTGWNVFNNLFCIHMPAWAAKARRSASKMVKSFSLFMSFHIYHELCPLGSSIFGKDRCYSSSFDGLVWWFLLFFYKIQGKGAKAHCDGSSSGAIRGLSYVALNWLETLFDPGPKRTFTNCAVLHSCQVSPSFPGGRLQPGRGRCRGKKWVRRGKWYFEKSFKEVAGPQTKFCRNACRGCKEKAQVFHALIFHFDKSFQCKRLPVHRLRPSRHPSYTGRKKYFLLKFIWIFFDDSFFWIAGIGC